MKAVFLDRDGTLNVEDPNYLTDINKLEIFEESYKAVQLLNEHGFKAIVITNQACVRKGLLEEKELQRINEKLKRSLESRNAKLDSIYYCPHHPDDQCLCRKPKTGMIDQAVKDHGVNPKKSFVIGDRIFDMGAGRAAGCRTILVLTGAGRQTLEKVTRTDLEPDYVAEHVLDAVRWVIQNDILSTNP